MINSFIAHFKTIINESNIDDVFYSVYSNIVSNKQKSLEPRSSWIISMIINALIGAWLDT